MRRERVAGPCHRRPWADGAPPPAGVRRHRLHAAVDERRAAGRAVWHRRGLRPAQPRRGRRRPGRAAGAGAACRPVRSAGRGCRSAQPRRHRQPDSAAGRRTGARLRLRPRQCAAGPVVPAASRPGLRRPGPLGGFRPGATRPCCSACWPSPSCTARRPRAPAATFSMRRGWRLRLRCSSSAPSPVDVQATLDRVQRLRGRAGADGPGTARPADCWSAAAAPSTII